MHRQLEGVFMKWAVSLLLVANVVFYLWSVGHQTYSVKKTVQTDQDVNLTGMVLTSEMASRSAERENISRESIKKDDQSAEKKKDQEQRPENKAEEKLGIVMKEGSQKKDNSLIKEGSRYVIADDQSANVDVVSSAVQAEGVSGVDDRKMGIDWRASTCMRIGPFKYKDKWLKANEWAKRKADKTSSVHSESREIRATRVYLGPFEGVEKTSPMVEILSKLKLDHYTYPLSDNSIRISLGYFTQEELAERFSRHLRSIGIDAQTEDEYRALGPFSWIEVSVPGNAFQLFKNHKWGEEQVEVVKIECTLKSSAVSRFD